MTTEVERPAARRPSTDSRHRGREAALQMLYQWEVGRASIDEVVDTFFQEPPAGVAGAARAFAEGLARGVAGQGAAIDPLIAGAADNWRIERMNVLDRLILRLAVYEFQHEPQTPAKVIINEALELARTFSAGESVAFINGILDAVRKALGRE